MIFQNASLRLTPRFSPRSRKNIRGVLDERYVVLNQIEKGGFSKVKLCIDTETNKKYAVKIFDEELTKTQSNMDSLSQEINTQIKFDHDNIAKLHSFNFSGRMREVNTVDPTSPKGIKYAIVELGEKGALFEMLQSKKHFPVKVARTFFKQIVNGLHSLHNNNIAHRDIKLENFVIDNDFNLKMIDFGFSCDINDTKKEHISHTKIIGTESYMAPEMLFERKYFADKSDIYSLGVLLFCMLAGQFPFLKAARYDATYLPFAYKREAGIKKFWESITKHLDIPHEAIELLNKMFAANPAERITLDNIMKSDFFNGEVENPEEIKKFFGGETQ